MDFVRYGAERRGGFRVSGFRSGLLWPCRQRAKERASERERKRARKREGTVALPRESERTRATERETERETERGYCCLAERERERDREKARWYRGLADAGKLDDVAGAPDSQVDLASALPPHQPSASDQIAMDASGKVAGRFIPVSWFSGAWSLQFFGARWSGPPCQCPATPPALSVASYMKRELT